MTSKIEFDNTFKLSKFSLLVSGVNISHVQKNIIINYFVNHILFFFNLFWLYTDVAGECYLLMEGVQTGKNYQELSILAPCLNMAWLATAKSASLYINRNKIIDIIDQLRKMHPIFGNNIEAILNANKDKNIKKSIKIQREIVKDSIKLLNVVISVLYHMSGLVIFAFCFISPLTICYNFYKNGELEMKLPFPVKYFFDPLVIWIWPFVYLHQVWSTLICCFNVLGTDTLFYALCIYIQMNFRILSHSFEYLAVTSSKRNLNKNCFKLIKRHLELTHLVEKVEGLYSTSTLINILISSIIICLCGFNIVFLDDTGNIFAFTTFLFMNLAQIFMLCYFGDMLMRSSTEVSNGIYNCNWYDFDESTKRTMLIVMTRAQKPCKLAAANFVDLNLRAFTTILNRSWSYFALLNSVYSENKNE